MKTGIFKTKYRTAEGRFTCSWLMILGKCLFVKHKKQPDKGCFGKGYFLCVVFLRRNENVTGSYF